MKKENKGLILVRLNFYIAEKKEETVASNDRDGSNSFFHRFEII